MSVLQQAAIDAAKLAAKATGVPASVTLAQFILESNWGRSVPPGSNNYFGIKARPGAPAVLSKTHEDIGGIHKLVEARFAIFASEAACFVSHANLLATHDDYAKAMAHKSDPVAFANALTGVYATDPEYGHKLIKLMRDQGLLQYDA